MEHLKIKDLTFFYPGQDTPALENVSITIQKGEFVTLFGTSGSGKTTLLRQCKPELSPVGRKSGDIFLDDISLEKQDTVSRVGFVMQHPEEHMVTDKVWHELAFGLESLGIKQEEMRGRVAETASFFGIEHWFHQKVSDLSGGQKQLLQLASIMVMQPELLLLDEPTAQLDPIAADTFLQMLHKINQELGTTILLSEHRLEAVFPLSDRVLAMDRGKVLYFDTPIMMGQALKEHPLFWSLPTAMRVFSSVGNPYLCPITVREGQDWISKMSEGKQLLPVPSDTHCVEGETILRAKELWFRYEKELPDVIKGVSLTVKKGEILSILGGNGTGKSTALSLLCGARKPYRGTVTITGKVGLLPQDPNTLFVKKTVEKELFEMLDHPMLSDQKRQEKMQKMIDSFQLSSILNRHPYDLSGGEKQRTALAKVLLTEPDLLLLDEPTKGMDGFLKQQFKGLLEQLKEQGISIVMVSHDIEFCAETSDRCGLFFDGQLISIEETRAFFAGKRFYTTAANRMARDVIPNAILAEDLIVALEGNVRDPQRIVPAPMIEPIEKTEEKKEKPIGKTTSIVRGLAFLSVVLLTILIGMYGLSNRKYYFISLLIIFESMGFFFVKLGHRKPRELVTIGVLCALAVASRSMFYMVPQIKPMMALVIMTGVAFGGETGFLVGAVAAFVSNMFFGQGAWTPWQMFSCGLIGYLSGWFFYGTFVKRLILSLFGFLSIFLLYGFILNTSSLLLWQENPTLSMLLVSLWQGIPFDLLHGGGTALFLWLLSKPVLEILERVKIKYGLFL